jgi:hypothetical protein
MLTRSGGAACSSGVVDAVGMVDHAAARLAVRDQRARLSA